MNAAAFALQKITTSRTNYLLSFAIDFATPVVLCYLGARHLSGDNSWLASIACFCAGAFVFTFIEYGLHRWLFHARASFATEIHREHHFSPLAPSSIPCPSSAAAGLLIWAFTMPLVGEQDACFLASGLISAYFYYSMLHHLQHRVRIKTVPRGWLRQRWSAHAIHHGRLDKNYGVTTSLWDHVFGTHYRPTRDS